MQDRLKREADFHDERFSNAASPRAGADRFYAVAAPSYDRYKSLVSNNVAGKSVLEYGCGPGEFAMQLAEEGALVDGIDISPATIARAKEKNKRCNFSVMNAESLLFEDNRFNIVCGSGILHHLDLSRAFKEIYRVLKPGGRGIFIEPLGHNPIINLYRNRTPEMRTSDEHPLVARDIENAGRYFRVSTEFFHCVGLAATVFPVLSNLFNRIDNIILSKWSPIRYAAWVVVVVFEKGC
jgi:SAM-dependent methyltransferase